ncbi:MAG: glucose-6-phosphate isomerase [Saccharofermentanales bacterium]
MIKFDYSNALPFIEKHELNNMNLQVKLAHEMIHKKTGAGSDYLGWVDLPSKYDKDEFAKIRKTAAKIRKDTDILVVIGIGGSYLGAKAAIDLLSHNFFNITSKRIRKAPQIVFAGNNLSSAYMDDLIDILDSKDVSLNVISKSGTTTEPAVAFRILKAYMEKRYGKAGAKNRIYATTDKNKGALKSLADKEGYNTFVVPDDIGGRFSVLTAVGLLPIAVAGLDIREIMKGSKDAMLLYRDSNIDENDCYAYAVARNCLLRKGYQIEVMANYEPNFHFMTEWWKQLFGESEGKDGRGIFPAGVDNTTDLHSMGQYIQDGVRTIFETTISVAKSRKSMMIPEDPSDSDGLNYLSGMNLDEVNNKARLGTILAHVDGGVPGFTISIPELNAYWFGQLVYFFEKACGISGYLLAVNPFDQPGVESYKKNMFALLGKPGYEKQKEELEKRLK